MPGRVQSGARHWNGNPADISGLVCWFRADQGVTYNVTGSVSQWNDLSGNGNNATQAANDLRPKLQGSTYLFGGQPTLLFSGTNTGLATSALGGGSIAQPTTHVVVCQINSPVAVNTQELTDGFGQRQALYCNGASGFFAAASISAAINSSFAPLAPTVAACVFNDPNTQIFANNSQVPIIAGSTGTANIDQLQISTPGQGWQGWIAEMILYSKALSPGERRDLFSYLAGRYRIGGVS